MPVRDKTTSLLKILIIITFIICLVGMFSGSVGLHGWIDTIMIFGLGVIPATAVIVIIWRAG